MFQAIVGFSLRHRVFVLIAAAILVAWGSYLARDMPIDLFPEIRQPSVIVDAEAPGLAAEEIELLITQPIEMAMSGMPGVASVRSRSANAVDYLQVLFEWGTDPYRNRQLVTERLALVRDQLPDNVVPVMAPMSAATGLDDAHGRHRRRQPDGAARICRLDAASSAAGNLGCFPGFSIGGEVRTYRFTPNPVLMRQMDVTLEQVETTLKAFGTNTTGGFSDVHGTEYTIRNIGKTNNLDDMRNLVVVYRKGVAVVLGQIGEVAFAPDRQARRRHIQRRAVGEPGGDQAAAR